MQREFAQRSALSLTCQLPGFRWLDCVITAPTGQATLAGYYLSDVLGDLASAAVALGEGEQAARCIWQQARLRENWELSRDHDYVQIQVLRSPILSEPSAGNVATSLLVAVCPLRSFLRQIEVQLLELSNLFTSEGYQCETGYAFPRATYRRLRRLTHTPVAKMCAVRQVREVSV